MANEWRKLFDNSIINYWHKTWWYNSGRLGYKNLGQMIPVPVLVTASLIPNSNVK